VPMPQGEIHSAELRGNLPARQLTRLRPGDYIAPTTARRPPFGAMARLRSSLTDSVTRRPIAFGSLGLRRLPGSPGRGIAMISGLFDK
jgi:hypothetical protein